jgi:hypothetical protein
VHDDVTPTGTQNLIHPYSLSKVVPKSERVEGDQNRNSCLGSKSMTTLEERLQHWILDRCHEENPRPRRLAELNAIFRDIYNDRRFWQYKNKENYNYYEDALSGMWKYFFLNLCEPKTARKRRALVLLTFWWKWFEKIRSDPFMQFEKFELWFFCLAEHHLSRKARSFLDTRDYAVGRLLINLKGHLKNIQKQIGEELDIYEPHQISEDGTVIALIDVLPNPDPDLVARQYNEFLSLLEENPTGELTDKENTLCGKGGAYTLTAQTYLLMRYRDDMTIHGIADKLGIPHGTLQGRGKPDRWKVLSQKYEQMAKDLVAE